MKQTFYFLFLATVIQIAGCNNAPSNQAEKTANAIRESMKTYGPGQVATSENGYSMNATIDGKSWMAKSMMEINKSNTHFISGENDEIKISFYIDRDHIGIGDSNKLGKGHSADLDLGGDDLMSAKNGEYIITKADDKVIEGTFHFTAGAFQSDKTKEVADGFFRILLQK